MQFSTRSPKQGLYCQEKPGKVMEFENVYFQAWKSHQKKIKSQIYKKSRKCVIFIYAVYILYALGFSLLV